MLESATPDGWAAEAGLHVGKIQIRSNEDVRSRLERALGLMPPDDPNLETRRSGLACASIASGEWLICGTPEDVRGALASVRELFAEDLCLAIDLSHGRFASTFSGAGAVAFFYNFSPLNIDEAHFPTGAAARTQLGDIGVYITRLDDKPTYRLIIDQSQTTYFRHLLSLGRATD